MASSPPAVLTMAKSMLGLPSRCSGPWVRPPSSFYEPTRVITVHVKDGDETASISMLHGILVFHSTYFAAALDPNGAFVESESNEIHIEDNIEAFRAFFCWAHTGLLKDLPAPEEISDRYLDHLTLCKIWVFGDMRGIPGLKNAAIDMLHRLSAVKRSPYGRVIKCTYNNTVEGSALRIFLVDLWTLTKGRAQFMEDDKNDHTVEFLHDIMKYWIASSETNPLDQKAWAKLGRCRCA